MTTKASHVAPIATVRNAKEALEALENYGFQAGVIAFVNDAPFIYVYGPGVTHAEAAWATACEWADGGGCDPWGIDVKTDDITVQN